MPAGRPTKYKPKYCQEIIKYFNIEPWREIYDIYTYKDGTTKETKRLIANDLPTLEGFATKIDVNIDTLNDWGKKHPEFLRAKEKAQALQKDILIKNSLAGLYQGNFAIFVAKNVTDMKDRTETDITSGGQPIGQPDPVKAAAFAEYMKNRPIGAIGDGSSQ